MESAIWGLVGTIVGAVASTGTSWLSSQNLLRLQNAKAGEERAERANAFQRQTLLDLQEAIHDALRLINRAYIEDRNSHRINKDWGTNTLTEEVNEGIRLAHRRVAILVERVSDDKLRTAVKTVMTLATQAVLSRSEREAEFHLEKTSSEANQVLESLGTALRSHY